jgi:DNA oxidative demethylase
MPRTGKEMSVRMTNCGALGWVTDKERGYRYQAPIPSPASPGRRSRRVSWRLWDAFAGWPQPPEACLVNFYDPSARMGLHQDRDEANLEAPVLSVSLGDACLFRVGGTRAAEAPCRSASKAATSCCSKAPAASASTASTGSTRARPTC